MLFVGVLWFVGKESQTTRSLTYSAYDNVAGARSEVTPARRSDGLLSAASSGTAAEDQPKNITRAFGNNVLNAYINNQTPEGGLGSLPEEETAQIQEETAALLQEEKQNIENRELVALTELSVTSEENEAARKQYILDVALAVSRPHFENAELGNETVHLMRAFNNANQKQRAKSEALLQKSAADYEGIKEELLEITVPVTLAPKHLELVNAYGDLALSSDLMRQSVRDPLLSVLASNLYFNAMQIILDTDFD